MTTRVYTGFALNRDPRHKFQSHRCEESLRHYASIRKYDGQREWSIYKHSPDLDWGFYHYYRETLAKDVSFCPWCGKRLRFRRLS